MSRPPILARQNWNTTSQIPAWQNTARDALETILEALVNLESQLLEHHDHAYLQTVEFKIAAEHVGSAWRAASHALGSIR